MLILRNYVKKINAKSPKKKWKHTHTQTLCKKIQFGKVDANGVEISEPISLDTHFDLKEINPVQKNPFVDEKNLKSQRDQPI